MTYQGKSNFPAPKFLDHVKLTMEDLIVSDQQTGGIIRYTVVVEYSPDLICIDADYLKWYLLQFGGDAVSNAEEIAPLLLNDLFEFLDCNWMEIKVIEEGALNKTAIASKSRSIDENGDFSPSSKR